ncbi:MAG TPA: type II secretion system protein [Tepidisphaeraceae bacterium]|jgi:prepilin-type N-terminal cleavage/methylation domain-containing protein
MRRIRAFTLVEVLAALVLIAVVLPVTMRVVTISIRAASHARHITEAGQLAELKIAELRLLTDTNSFGGSGTFPDKPEYRWEVTSNYVNYGCYEVIVRVVWREQGSERSTSLATLIHPTKSAEPAEPEAAS